MLGVLVGMALEAQIIETVARNLGVYSDVLVAIATPDGAGRRGSVAGLAERGASRVVSFGLAGGLDARLRAGDIVCPAQILSPDGAAHDAAATWRADLFRTDATIQPIERLAGVAAPVLSVADKVALFAASRAAAADMESHVAAHDAAQARLPFIALRVIVDAGDRDVPRTAAAAMGKGGRIAPARLIGGILRRPGDLAGLIALGRDMRAARAGMERAARALLQSTGEPA